MVLPSARHEPKLAHAVHAEAPRALKKPTSHEKPAVVTVVLATVCGALTVKLHGSALVTEQVPAVMVVPGVTPAPASVAPTLMAPASMADRVRDRPANVPVALASPVPKGQNEPAGHAVPAISPATQKVPAAHAFASADALPTAAQKPGAHVSAPERVEPAATVCEGDTAYMPTPPVPEFKAVMTVPATRPGPESTMPTSSAPEVTEVTVRVVPEMPPTTIGAVAPAMVVPATTVCDVLTVTAQGKALSTEQEPPVTVVPAAMPAPESIMPTASVPDVMPVTESAVPAMPPVKDALGNDGGAPRPAGQKKPAGHAFVVPAACPARQ